MNINPDKTPTDVFYEFLNNSVISYVGAGSSGLGLLSANTINDSYKILTTNNENVVCSKIFIKLVPISDAYKKTRFKLSLPDIYPALISSSTEFEFWNEVNIQTHIYKETNEGLEPVCPPIVYSESLDNDKSMEMLNKLFLLPYSSYDHDMSTDPIFELYNRYKGDPTLKLGIIGMGFTEGYNSLFTIFRNNHPNITNYFDLAIYELLRLYVIGYLHGDISLANIMINTDYNYTGTNSGRAMLIDFGMTFDHEYEDTPDIPVILERMRTTRTPATELNPMEHANYKWFTNYTTNIENVSRAIRRLITSITSHNEKMIDMIATTYPDVLAQIRTYNGNSQYKNIFYGGLKNTSQIEDVITPDYKMIHVKAEPKSKSNTLSITEFNHIFNPNNLDIPQLLDAYLHTLHLGNQSIKEGIKSVTGKMGGKKQKRSSQNRKRGHKQKTRRRQVYRSKKTHRRHR
jgi:hypothetical protein